MCSVFQQIKFNDNEKRNPKASPATTAMPVSNPGSQGDQSNPQQRQSSGKAQAF